jgi:periplasmic divalent cation tolerance protein
MTDFVFIYITHPDAEQATVLGGSLVEAGLAACVNILPGMLSIYQWQGQIETSEEVVILVKTRRELIEDVQAYVLQTHPYDCPCIVALPVVAGNPAFLDWIAQSTTRHGA